MAAPSARALTRTPCTQSLPKQCQTSLDVCSASDGDPRTRRRRRRVSGSPERRVARPPTTVWDSERLPNTAEPRHCKGISPLCFLKQFGIKGWKKKCSVCVRVCGRAVSAWDLESSRMNRKGPPHAHNRIFFLIQVVYSVLPVVWGHMTGIDMSYQIV